MTNDDRFVLQSKWGRLKITLVFFCVRTVFSGAGLKFAFDYNYTVRLVFTTFFHGSSFPASARTARYGAKRVHGRVRLSERAESSPVFRAPFDTTQAADDRYRPKPTRRIPNRVSFRNRWRNAYNYNFLGFFAATFGANTHHPEVTLTLPAVKSCSNFGSWPSQKIP